MVKVYCPHITTRSCVLNQGIVTTLYLSPAEMVGPSQIGSLVVRLAVLPDDKSVIKGKQRILSEVKEDAKLKLVYKLHPETESSGHVSTPSDPCRGH